MDSNGPLDIFHLDIVKQSMIKKKRIEICKPNFHHASPPCFPGFAWCNFRVLCPVSWFYAQSQTSVAMGWRLVDHVILGNHVTKGQSGSTA